MAALKLLVGNKSINQCGLPRLTLLGCGLLEDTVYVLVPHLPLSVWCNRPLIIDSFLFVFFHFNIHFLKKIELPVITAGSDIREPLL